MNPRPADRLAEPFVRVLPGDGPADENDLESTPVVSVDADGHLSSGTLEDLRKLSADFPDYLPVRPTEAHPVSRLHGPSGQRLGFVALTPTSTAQARQSGALLGAMLDAGDQVSLDLLKDQGPEIALSFVSGVQLGADRPSLRDREGQLTVAVPLDGGLDVEALRDRVARNRGRLFARRLANIPSNFKSPDWLAEQALALVDDRLTVEVLRAPTLEELGFGGVLAVGQGSERPPNVTILRWRGTEPDGTPTKVIVGKGITFDSGGLSIKPAGSMTLMRTDMSGAAAVLGAFAILHQVRPDESAIGVIACAENMPGGSAMRPGDVVRHFGGRTTEVLNTDAEGRLVLADAIAYAHAELNPSAIVDVATLTGSATMGLGRQHAAAYSTAPELLAQLEAAADSTADAIWPMPLVPEYEGALDSTVADAANINTDVHTSAGSITAALFLRPFARATPWAHLDIAGPGRRESAAPGMPKGATGYGTELLAAWLAPAPSER